MKVAALLELFSDTDSVEKELPIVNNVLSERVKGRLGRDATSSKINVFIAQR